MRQEACTGHRDVVGAVEFLAPVPCSAEHEECRCSRQGSSFDSKQLVGSMSELLERARADTLFTNWSIFTAHQLPGTEGSSGLPLLAHAGRVHAQLLAQSAWTLRRRARKEQCVRAMPGVPVVLASPEQVIEPVLYVGCADRRSTYGQRVERGLIRLRAIR